jgi:hypothetical protein
MLLLLNKQCRMVNLSAASRQSQMLLKGQDLAIWLVAGAMSVVAKTDQTGDCMHRIHRVH